MGHKSKVRIFKQNQTMETCVCCCILMALDYFHALPGGRNHPTREMEDQIYGYLGYHVQGTNLEKRFCRGTPLSAAAFFLSQQGLAVAMYHSEAEYLCNTCKGSPYYPEEVFPTILEKYRYWLEKGRDRIVQKSCAELTGALFAELLDRQELLLVACMADSDDGETLHGILIDYYQEESGKRSFHVCNPATGKHFLDEEELLERMDTPVGIHFLSVGEYAGA